MIIDDERLSLSVRELGKRLMQFAEELTGQRPYLRPGRKKVYKVEAGGKAVVWIRLIGPQAKKYRPNSIGLNTRRTPAVVDWWKQRFGTEAPIENNLKSVHTTELFVCPETHGDTELAEDFIRAVYAGRRIPARI